MSDIEIRDYDVIDGRHLYLSTFPLSGVSPRRYTKIASVLAAQAVHDGEVDTPEGTMWYKEGDYIVTDDPPTHAWPVKREVFERTYRYTV
jgi:hypothetical protein